MWGNYWGYPMMGFWGGGIGMIFMIFWWLLVIAAIILFARWLVEQTRHGGKTALDILKERYAKGEISKEQYEAMKKDLL
ncbi:MAG: SHOCT domain-containing protein [bacterium]|nr:SHOCT domain-containing protein [bacterium]